MENEEKKESVASENTEVTATKKTPFNATVLGFGFLGALVIGVLVFYGVILSQVKKLSDNSVVVKSAEVLRIPAVKAQGDTLLYADYMNDLQSLKKLSSNPQFGFGPATDQDLSDLVVANFLTTVKTKDLAQKWNVQVSAEEVNARKQELVSQYGEETVQKQIQDSYGWDLDTFVKKIIEPSLLNAKVKETFEKSTDQEGATFTRDEAHVKHILIGVQDMNDAKEKAEKKKKAEDILKRLQKGEDFAKLAGEFSEDPGSKAQGGDLGWVPKGQTVKPFDDVAFTLPLKKLSNVVETEYGFHILWVEERRTIKDFDTYMDTEIRKMQPVFAVPIHNPLENIQAAPEVVPPAGQ